MGGSDSFTIIGTSGIGKSSAISKAINLITENRVIEADNPYTNVVPCVTVQGWNLAIINSKILWLTQHYCYT